MSPSLSKTCFWTSANFRLCLFFIIVSFFSRRQRICYIKRDQEVDFNFSLQINDCKTKEGCSLRKYVFEIV